MSVNLPKDTSSVHFNTGPEIKKNTPKNTLSRNQIPPAETQHHSPDINLQEVKNHTLVLSPEDRQQLKVAVKENNIGFLKVKLSPAVISAYNRQESRPLLHEAVLKKNTEAVALILDHKTELNAQDKAGNSPVHMAIAVYDLEILRQLLEAGCSPNLIDRNGRTPLHDASGRDTKFVQLLLKYKANPAVTTPVGETPERIAIQDKHAENAKLLREATPGFDAAVHQTKMLGLRFGLSEEIQVNGSKMLLGDAYRSDYTWPQLEQSIQSWINNSGFMLPTNEYGEEILDQADMQEILASVKRGYSENPIDSNANLHMLRAGTSDHHTSVVASDKHICECNRGGYSEGRPGIIMYEFLDQNLISREELLKQFQTSKGNANYQAKYRKPPYVKEIDYVPHHDQSGPTCTWAQAKLAFRAALMLKLEGKVPHDIARQISLGMYKNFTTYDRESAVREFMHDPYFDKADSPVDKDQVLKFVFHKTINTRFFPIMNTLLATGKMDETATSKTGETLLHIAVKTRNYPQLQALLAQGFDVNQGDKKGITPFHIACAMGDPNIMQMFFPTADLQKADNHGNTPLHIAAQEGNPFLVGHLLQNGVDPLAVTKSGQNALHLAAKNPNSYVIQWLVNAGTPVSSFDKQMISPLHIACVNGNYVLAQFLIDRDADLNVRDTNGNTPFMSACKWNMPDLINAMVEKGANFEDGLRAAKEAGNIAIVDLLKRHQLEKKAEDVSDQTLLDVRNSLRSGNYKTFEHYLSPEVIVAYNRRTPTSIFTDCIETRNPEVLKMVLKHQTELDYVDEKGSIAHQGANHPNIYFLRAIVDAKCPMNLQDGDGNTALHIAATKDSSFVNELLAGQADPRIQNYKGETPEMIAAQSNKTHNAKNLREETERLTSLNS